MAQWPDDPITQSRLTSDLRPRGGFVFSNRSAPEHPGTSWNIREHGGTSGNTCTHERLENRGWRIALTSAQLRRSAEIGHLRAFSGMVFPSRRVDARDPRSSILDPPSSILPAHRPSTLNGRAAHLRRAKRNIMPANRIRRSRPRMLRQDFRAMALRAKRSAGAARRSNETPQVVAKPIDLR
jgi:hypothetical protein